MKQMIIGVMLSVSLLAFNDLLFADETREFQIIVNVSNSLGKLTEKDISNMFLKKLTRWNDSDELVYPVDLLGDSEVREAFSQTIHRRKVSSIKAYWQRQIFSGREIPPPEKETDKDVLEYIAQKTGAIGYISISTEIEGRDVKLIEIMKK